MNTLTLEEVIARIVARLTEKGFNTKEVPNEEKNSTLNRVLPNGYTEYRVIYEGNTVFFLELWESDSGTVQVYILKRLPEFDRLDNKEYIESIVNDYYGGHLWGKLYGGQLNSI